jgi:multidrug efflux pump subunit AcrB
MDNPSKIKTQTKASSFTLIVAFICVALIGLALIPLLPVKLNPSRTLPGFTVQFSMPGTSSRVVEIEATSKLEAMLARIKGIKNIYSTSDNGSGSITIELDKYADIDAVRFEASTIVRQSWSQLPAGLSYPVLQVSRPDDKEARAFMSYTLNAAATPVFIQRYAEEQIKPRLSSIKGIYRIDVKGATPMEWRLTYNNDQLISLGITVNKLQEAIRQYYNQEFLGTANVQLSKGEKEWIRLALVSEAPENGFDPSKISVSTPDGEVISLAKLIRVTRQEEMPQSYYRINGLNSIYFLANANLQKKQTPNCLIKPRF